MVEDETNPNDADSYEFVHAAARPERLDKLVCAHVGEGVSREKVKKAIAAGLCSIEGEVCLEASQKVRPGHCVRIRLLPELSRLEAETGDVAVLWQDAHLLVINKAAGLTVHPAPSCPQGTLVQRLLGRCPELRSHEGWRPGIVHRLDKDTTGLILIAPDEAARLKLAQAFAQREIEKIYLAVVSGVMQPASGDCLEPLGRDPVRKTRMAVVPGGRPAHTEWRTLYTDPAGAFSLLAVTLHTGRTHQIRVHMAHLGHPVVGDATYGRARHGLPEGLSIPRQMLHARLLKIAHPRDGRPLEFTAPPPPDILAAQTLLVSPCV